MEKVKAAIFGAATGDALGVPVEFMSRDALRKNPVTDMRAFGTHHQPAGTWSDDSSLLFCTAESLCGGYDIEDMSSKFRDWLYRKIWTPHDEVFDVGNATRAAIERLKRGISPKASGLTGEHDNGNGSLMRILPLVFFLEDEPSPDARMRTVREVSSITHAHPVSYLACTLYVEMGLRLLKGSTTGEALYEAAAMLSACINGNAEERFLPCFGRLASGPFRELPERDIASGGYVLHTLEAAVWCLLTSHTFAETVLKAVNLGGDTDTTACVAGGLAGLRFGLDAVPETWIDSLARRKDIEDLISRFCKSLGQK